MVCPDPTIPSLELRGVGKRYDGVAAVRELSFSVAPGTVFGLLGPNGAGKTTTLRMIMNIVAPDRGDVLLFGRPRDSDSFRRIGYLPEERGLYKKMTVREQLVFLGEIQGLARQEALDATTTWLGRLGLGDRATSRVETLSKGMQQKIQLAAILLHDPELLILDEPFTGLDPINQVLFQELFQEFKRRRRTILLSTHVMDHAEKLCDAICLLSRGERVLLGGLAELKRAHGGHRYRLVARGDLSRIESLAQVDAAVQADGGVDLLLRPEASGPDVLRELVTFLDVLEFRAREPRLEDIFVDVVRRAS